MKSKNTLVLSLFALAFGAFIFFYERNQPTTQEARAQAGRVVELDRDKIQAVTIKNPETTIELRKTGEQWFLEEPIKDRADMITIASLFTSAEGLRSENVIGNDQKGAEKEQLKDFGLSNPTTRVKFTGPEKTVELLLGKETAVEGKVYARLEDSKKVYVIGQDLKNQVSKKADDFRDRKLTDVVATQVNKVQIKAPAGEIELAKKDDEWSLVKPLRARGDAQKIGDLVAKAANARIESFVADSANLSAFGLQDPCGTVTLFTEGSEKPTVLQVGQAVEKEKEKVYAKLSTRGSVVVLPKTVESLLTTTPNDLRDRNLVRVQSDIVDRMTIEAPGHEKIVLARNGELWVRNAGDKDVPVNVAAATRLLADLQGQQVTNFVADVASDLPKYGLDQPQLKITLSSYASENTAETKAGEKPIVTVLFGKIVEQDVYARVEEEPFIVSVPQTILQSAMSDPVQWQELTIFRHRPEDVVAVEITREGEPAVSLEREKEKPWKLAKGDGAVNQTNVQSMVNTLAKLRAVRWIGATIPEHGLEKPVLTASFRTASGQSEKLSVGVKTPDELGCATADGRTGTFGIAMPDLTALQLPLIEKPTMAAGTPAATPESPTPTPGGVPPLPTAPATTPESARGQ